MERERWEDEKKSQWNNEYQFAMLEAENDEIYKIRNLLEKQGCYEYESYVFESSVI